MASAPRNRVFIVGVGMTKFEKPGRRVRAERWLRPRIFRRSLP